MKPRVADVALWVVSVFWLFIAALTVAAALGQDQDPFGVTTTTPAPAPATEE